MLHSLSSPNALTLAILAACLALAQPGPASAADAPARPRDPVNISGQFKGAKEAVQKISDALPQPLYDAIKSRNLSLMVYTKNFTFSNSKKNWCWAYVGITTPATDGRAERLAPGATTSVFNTEKDFDCRLNAVASAISDGAKLLQFAQSRQLALTVPAGKAPAEAKELLLFSTYDEPQNQWILNGVPPRFLAAFDVRQVRLMSGFERSVIGDDVLCVATAAVTAASPDDRTPRVPPELEVGTALLPGAARPSPKDADCWKAAVGGAFTKLLSRPWDTGLLGGLTAAREDWSRLPTPDGVRAAVAKYDKAHPSSANGAR
jgi:hypothetical protein